MNYIFVHLLDNKVFYSSLMHGTNMKIICNLFVSSCEEGSTGQEIYCQIKWLSVRQVTNYVFLISTDRNIQQPFRPRDA